MKMRSRFFTPLRPGGILRWSTACILAGGMVGMTGCERKYVATERDQKMAQVQSKLVALDAQKAKLAGGEVENNFNLPGLGFYHAEARDFFEYPYGFEQDGRWFVNGKWQDQPQAEAAVAASRPTPEALKKVEDALDREQQLLASQDKGAFATAGHNSNQGLGCGTALMMYWLISGNRGSYRPGPGFQQAGVQAATWQRGVDDQRRSVSAYASANPGYSRLVAQSNRSGNTVTAGQSVRGGFGASGKSSSSAT
ncbi:MAG: hypothetical protein WCK77_06340 [Verrucomicrobiota bacterium]